eukprot:3688583-Amphidinium_carterae.1
MSGVHSKVLLNSLACATVRLEAPEGVVGAMSFRVLHFTLNDDEGGPAHHPRIHKQKRAPNLNFFSVRP